MNEFKDLFENSVLNEETKAALAEAWDKKIADVKSSLREEIENDFKLRYEKDKGNLVEAMENMLGDAIAQYGSEMATEAKKLREEKAALSAAVVETRKEYTSKLNDNMAIFEKVVAEAVQAKVDELEEEKAAVNKKMVEVAKKEARTKAAQKEKLKEDAEKLQNFVLSKLSEEIARLRDSEKVYAESIKKADADVREHKLKINEEMAARVNKLETFILSQLKEEISEFKSEKDSLSRLRVKMVKESRDNLNKVRTEFVSRAASILETKISESIKSELTTLKEDIKIARDNTFGRKLFETFANEFMRSHLAEGTKVRSMENLLSEATEKLNAKEQALSEQKKLYENAQIRLKLSEDRINRAKTMDKLLCTLNKDKRDVMESLLESVKTPDLEKSFHNYLNVLNEEAKPRTKTVLSEMHQRRAPTREISGDKKIINESLLAETENDHNSADAEAEINELRRRAGIRN